MKIAGPILGVAMAVAAGCELPDGGMWETKGGGDAGDATTARTSFSCSRDGGQYPQPGNCPACGSSLVEVTTSGVPASDAPAPGAKRKK